MKKGSGVHRTSSNFGARLASLAVALLFLSQNTSALAVADSVICTLPFIPAENPTPWNALPTAMHIDGFSQTAPRVAIFGHQVMELRKDSLDSENYQFDARSSRFKVRLDTAKMRVVVIAKDAPQEKSVVAGGCEAL